MLSHCQAASLRQYLGWDHTIYVDPEKAEKDLEKSLKSMRGRLSRSANKVD